MEPSIIRLQEKVIITLFIIWIMSTDNPMPEGLVEMYIRELADAGKGISILGSINGLNINIGELLNLINAYIPEISYAGVKSEDGLEFLQMRFDRMIVILEVPVAISGMAVVFR